MSGARGLAVSQCATLAAKFPAKMGVPRKSPTSEPRLTAICALLTVVAVVGLQADRAAESPVLSNLMRRTGDQVRRFEQDFTLVVSDEDYLQHEIGRAVIGFKKRRTHAEMLFFWVPQERIWLTVRNVLTLDGHPIPASGGRLDEALQSDGPDRLAGLRGIINDNARFNVGRFKRNFNYPTLVLSFLDPAVQPRFAFSLAGRERLSGIDVWKVKYEERGKPTVIQGDGVDIKSRGSVWIAVESGAVMRTLLELTISNLGTSASAGVTVDYHLNPNLNMWVPAQMRETYVEMRGSTVSENNGGEATYSNFRRFATTARMVPPP